MDYNPERVECFCLECARSSILGFREVIIYNESSTPSVLNQLIREYTTFEGEQPFLSEASDNMDNDEMDVGDDIPNEPSTSRSLSWMLLLVVVCRSLTRNIVFRVEENRDSTGGTDRLLDAEDVEWEVEADNVNVDETASIDEQVALRL
ncbi:hypothetical protein BDB00DRAFT_793523 [Zychaea mexicana]|uniref:uncharacterized protein n=1 Tax=Zychaea mexicana TaxID=64656 RepID=UPI0022FE36F6|nr:uncharacterized protein BDB00DRAFT_793523 [Zychaea mexicana]KAI9472896.1 hypothetical protein BDB00DRAFT_793523 [Zychaea mexicana]